MPAKEKSRLKEQSAWKKIKSGTDNITYSDCVLAVNYDGQIISSIPTEFITEDLCVAALNNNSSSKNLIQYIPQKILTEKLAVSIVSINGIYLKYLPPEVISKNIILAAAKQKLNAIKYIPDKFKTDEFFKALIDLSPKSLKYLEAPGAVVCEYAISKEPNAISYIKNDSALTIEICKKAIEADWKNLRYIPSDRVTRDLCDYAFRQSWKAFKLFPDIFKTTEYCKTVTSMDASYLQYCPKSKLNTDICEKCIKKHGKLLEFVPECLKTETLCLLAVKQDYEALRFLPSNLLSNDFYIRCFQVNQAVIYLIPNEYKTFEAYKYFLNQIIFSYAFKEWLKSEEKICSINNLDYLTYCGLKNLATTADESTVDYNVLKTERGLNLRRTVNSYYDSETDIFVVEELYFKNTEKHEFSDFKDFYAYLNENINGSNLTEYIFDETDISSYNLEGAFLSGEFLIRQGRYNGTFYNSAIGQFSEEISQLPVLKNETIKAELITHDETDFEKLNAYDRKIFYITDIHLDHRLIDRFPRYATFEEVEFFIQKYVKKIINTASEKGYYDYLLIGGDVSFSFDISKIFYTELCKYWDPGKIVVVLGNHELWCFDSEKNNDTKEKSVENIAERYRMLFSELGISFLQNAMLIGKRYFSETDILNKSPEELRFLALNSNLIIFGGTGFSAYNPNFNATHGIYRSVITSIERDLYYTQQTERVYNKLQEIFSKEKVIVLSHMPPSDWSRSNLVPNWIYINGHTHRNRYVHSEKCTVYADNQVGYKSKTVALKYFKIGLHYDIFRYHPDGIYHISKAQYMEFNKGNNTWCTFNKEVNDITMLKRQGIYLFLLEDKNNGKLFLLNGGVINRLKNTDVNYYYSNMAKYADYIKAGIRKYNEVLKSISDVVKKIGGDGAIHGCIVDIDFFDHIYLNPHDGSINAYYSPIFGERFEYPTVEQLLEKQLPQLYANYRNLIGESKDLTVISNKDGSSGEAIHIFDTTQYKSSRLIKRLQYITENNVIRIWSDDFISNHEQYIAGTKKLLT